MRFRRRPRAVFVATDRKRAAARRAQRRRREAVPLLAALVAEAQPPVDAVMEDRAARAAAAEQDWRDRGAGLWREARRALGALPPDLRRAALAHWNNHRWLPGDPAYLCGVLRALAQGRLAPTPDGATLEEVRAVRTPEEQAAWRASADALAEGGGRKPRARGWVAGPAGPADAPRAARRRPPTPQKGTTP